jgi:hippurate hydrolase
VQYVKELLGEQSVMTAGQLSAMSGASGKAVKTSGSEDFAYISQEVPAIMMSVAAGHPDQGYAYPQHHPKVKFDESVLPSGGAIYAYTAMRWLQEHR